MYGNDFEATSFFPSVNNDYTRVAAKPKCLNVQNFRAHCTISSPEPAHLPSCFSAFLSCPSRPANETPSSRRSRYARAFPPF